MPIIRSRYQFPHDLRTGSIIILKSKMLWQFVKTHKDTKIRLELKTMGRHYYNSLQFAFDILLSKYQNLYSFHSYYYVPFNVNMQINFRYHFL